MSDKPPPEPLSGIPPQTGPPVSGPPPGGPPPPSTDTGVVVDEIVEDKLPLPLKAGTPPRLGSKASLPEHRFKLAVALLATVSILAIGLVLAVMFTGETRLESIRSIAAIIFGPLVTLLGTSFAWYFAKNSDSDS